MLVLGARLSITDASIVPCICAEASVVRRLRLVRVCLASAQSGALLAQPRCFVGLVSMASWHGTTCPTQ